MIYFIRAQTGDIKIGYSATPERRLSSMQTGSPVSLELVALIPGSKQDERHLHEQFAGQRNRGEWFTPSAELDALIASCQLASGESPASANSRRTETNRRLKVAGGWIEFRQKNGRRYARRRAWEKQNGQWVKVFKGREAHIPVMTEEEYKNYVYKRDLAKRIRAGH